MLDDKLLDDKLLGDKLLPDISVKIRLSNKLLKNKSTNSFELELLSTVVNEDGKTLEDKSILSDISEILLLLGET